jgi:hypothetical protein
VGAGGEGRRYNLQIILLDTSGRRNFTVENVQKLGQPVVYEIITNNLSQHLHIIHLFILLQVDWLTVILVCFPKSFLVSLSWSSIFPQFRISSAIRQGRSFDSLLFRVLSLFSTTHCMKIFTLTSVCCHRWKAD